MATSGILTQLAAVGAQDAYLTLNPCMTFFKGSYKRYTNFAVGQIEQTFQGGITYGKRLTSIIQRNGDLLAETYFVIHLDALQAIISSHDVAGLALEEQCDIPTGYPCRNIIDPCRAWGVHFVNAVGHALIEWVSVSIGGHEFDCHTGDFLHIWEALTHQPGKPLGSLIGEAKDIDTLLEYASNVQILYVPFKFWFNRAWEQALPLIALQYHEVRIDMKLNRRDQMIKFNCPADIPVDIEFTAEGGDILDCFLLCNYVFLDTFERRLFAAKAHTQLFDQLQFTGPEPKPESTNVKNIELRFNHPIIELLWVIQTQEAIENADWFDYSLHCPNPCSCLDDHGIDPMVSAQLQLNGHARFNERDAVYFNKVVPYECHTEIPHIFVYVYSFAKCPEDPLQPSGTLNASRIDNMVLNLKLHENMGQGEIRIYARSKNVLRIISGMAGVRYSN